MSKWQLYLGYQGGRFVDAEVNMDSVWEGTTVTVTMNWTTLSAPF